MVRLEHDGLELWYGTSDAPAPEGGSVGRDAASVTVGVRPANPSNTVVVRYQVDGRAPQRMSAPLIENDYQRGIQYFRADFPTFWAGDYVEYVPVLSCAGRRAPDPATAHTFPSSFRLDPMPPLVRATTPPAAANPQPTFQARLEHLVSVNVQLARQPELIGQTPAGYVVNWPPIEGALDGPAFHARIVPGGDHETIVRPDGIGILRVRVSVETDDHALISLEYSGAVEYGENWTEWLRAGRWPEALAVRSGIRMLTSASRYKWLNRLQCIGVGEVFPHELSYRYDMYAVR